MSEQLFARSMMVAAVLFSVVGIAFICFPLGWFFDFHWPLGAVLAWDAALSLLFFTQHSGMLRLRPVLAVPEPYWGVVYAVASGAALIVVAVLWQAAGPLFSLHGLPRLAARAAAVFAVASFVWGIVALKNFDPCGLDVMRAHLRGKRPRPMPFMVRGPYRWVRHPLYAAVLLLMWSFPDVSLDRLLFNLLWTVWICAACRWEEADLVRQFGAEYERYRRQVPMLVPWRGRVDFHDHHRHALGGHARHV